MNKLIPILKATMAEGIQLFNYRARTERSRRLMPFLLATLIGTCMLFSASAMTLEFKEDGVAPTATLSLYVIITAIIIIMEGIYKSGDLLFSPRDNDLLLSMPIEKSTIVFARIIKFYAFEMLYCLIFLLPAILAYAINVETDFFFWLTSITMLLLVPIVPITISCIIGLISSIISAKFKRRTFLQVLISFFFLFVFAIMILAFNTTSEFDGSSVAAFSDKIANFYYPASAFVDLVVNFNIWQYLIFIAVNLVVFAVTVAFIGRFYFQTVTNLSAVKQAEHASIKYDFTKHSQTFAMVKKELTKYFNTPVLLMNTAIGLVLFAVAVGALCFNYDGLMASLISSLEDFPLTAEELYFYLPSAAFAMVAFASLMTFITTTMISLEGKAFNMLKSMPISGKKVIMTKVLAAMILIIPVTAIGSIVMAIRFNFSILNTVLVLMAVVVMPLVTELIGILIDLKYARFDAESDAVVVKQSAGVLVSTFLGLGMVLVTISLAFAIVFIAGQTASLIIMDSTFAIVAAFLYFVIAARGEKKYTKLVA